MEESEREKVRRANCHAEPIFRSHSETFHPIIAPAHTPRGFYPWESELNLPRITKDFFRCKGSGLNQALTEVTDSGVPNVITDCEGSGRHGLPIIHGKEGVYPILVDLLNYVQKKTGHRVVITCGHRCPVHNAYADRSKENQTSKHQIGAEVDFYVQGMEERPQEIAGMIMQYFQETAPYKNEKESREFKRFEKTDLTVYPWMNKEIFLKLYQKHEGRDWDNRHPHPYLSIQVRYDREAKERVVYSWTKANQGYLRS
jgi:hypothetical protein